MGGTDLNNPRRATPGEGQKSSSDSLATFLKTHQKGGASCDEDSVGGTPTDAVGTTALPKKPPMIGESSRLRGNHLDGFDAPGEVADEDDDDDDDDDDDPLSLPPCPAAAPPPPPPGA